MVYTDRLSYRLLLVTASTADKRLGDGPHGHDSLHNQDWVPPIRGVV